MKYVNLISLVEAYKTADKTVNAKYLKYIKTSPKSHEIDDIEMLIQELLVIGKSIKMFNCFYFGYIIPQIGKEFDLLRFGIDSILNIEIKRTSDEVKIKNQLIKNRYYLNFLNLEISSYTFISSTKKLYTLDGDSLKEVDISDLFESLENQKTVEIDDINSLFNPTDYLISPFNSTEKFVDSEYFLTNDQDQTKKKVLDKLSIVGANFVLLTGKAGTGKSLLTYDIANEYIRKTKRVLIIHCGQLNNGHIMLRDDYIWDIIPAKDIFKKNLSKYYLVIIDETQRIFPNQLQHIINEIKDTDGNCLFSYDMSQCLRSTELKNNIEAVILGQTKATKFELTDKIRTNKEIASFIKCLFDKAYKIHPDEPKNVELNYFSNYESVTEYLHYLKQEDWKIVNYTPSRVHYYPYDEFVIYGEDSTHQVIGQEYDKVVAVIDEHFYYKGNDLSTKNYKNQPYYHPTKMLFQTVTRTRKKLNIIIVNNDEILDRCLDILKLK